MRGDIRRAARPTVFAGAPSIASCPGLALGCWSVSASCRVAAMSPICGPVSKTWSGASISTASGTSGRLCLRAHACHGATERRSETKSGTRSERTRSGRRASGWRMSGVSCGQIETRSQERLGGGHQSLRSTHLLFNHPQTLCLDSFS